MDKEKLVKIFIYLTEGCIIIYFIYLMYRAANWLYYF
ncbi:hypothetical protein Q428_05095 [Fervidicella metallireducens AeB]|uniref:Uncharacterized protein n=1 Tax=Fervidicella metallireducens AeB TaxID=1403537 RepID=A0A017RYQ6_9CLOT|nr:hypothetical protein Q428_05095 [Fervidicella metallireducens AeB]